MGLINSILTWVMQKRIHQIELFIKYPNEVQEELFKKLINSAKGTEFGLRYDFSSIS
ncbi:MAG TPA: GH3 auxin-responsive promoter family protein, partial [Chryseolinea sp.]